MKNYRYDLIGASVKYGVNKHPQQDMIDLGFNIIKSEPVPIADCWWFRVSNEIEYVPPYITELSKDFMFSDECEERFMK